MRILVVGAGAVGGYFGARLARAGRDVTFLVRPARAERLAARGLRIHTTEGTTERLTPALATADAIDGPYELVLLSVKAFGLDRAVADLAGAVADTGVVVPLLNGMAHLETLTAAFGAHRVYGGVCMVQTTLDSDGDVRQLSDLQSLTFGPLDGVEDDRLAAVAAALGGAAFAATPTTRIRQHMWEKWVFLASLGAVTCLMRGTIGEIATAPGGAAFAAAALDEAAAVATAAGYPPDPEFLATGRRRLTDTDATTTSSLYRDLTGGAAVEGDHILGDLVGRAAALGVAAPLLGLAHTQVSVHSARIGRG